MAYRIGELSKLIGVSEHTLRFYEKEGLVVPDRDKNNIRTYSEHHKLWVEFILHMKETGMTLEALKKYTKLWEAGEEGTVEMVSILVDHREKVKKQLDIFQKNLDLLDKKIDFYQNRSADNTSGKLYEEFVDRKNSKKEHRFLKE